MLSLARLGQVRMAFPADNLYSRIYAAGGRWLFAWPVLALMAAIALVGVVLLVTPPALVMGSLPAVLATARSRSSSTNLRTR